MSRGIVEIIGSIFAGRRRSEGGRGAVEIKLPSNGDVASIYSRDPHSSILASVLSNPQDAPGRQIQIKPRRDAQRPSVARKVGVGDELRKARETVLESGQKLAGLCDPALADYINRLLTMIESQHCNIAFIGQMNAGKSSLINSFIGAPKFLPTEITPWTTVVTNLYFGIPKLPVSGALFEFFNKTEWQQLAEGSVRVRSLTERLIPNFPWQDFYRQVGNMREKAEEKLGSRYAELLGSQHAFPIVTGEILEKYIAAESPLGDLDEGTAGEYSMITKAAHLYFELNSFFYPSIVIDTPGVNDPFLVRDEITRQNLERANIFVIVVTARQPLSNADLDLLRILRGLNKDNIIIFVNKIDELDDFETNSGPLAERIRGLLKKEFPASDIPIVMGSALWAEVALGDSLAEKRRLANTPALEGVRSASIDEDTAGFWPKDPSVENTMLSDGILMRSGVPDLALAVSEMLRVGTIANGIKYGASVLTSVARNGGARCAENAALASRLAAESEPGHAEMPATEAVRSSQATAEDIGKSIEARIDATEAGFKTIIQTNTDAVLNRLKGKVRACIDALRQPGASKAEASGAAQLGPLVVRLRSELEQEFLTQFHDALQRMTDLSHDAEEALQADLAQAAEALNIGVHYCELPVLKSSPSLSALGEPVASDLGGLLYGQWGSKPLASPERAEEMRGLVAAEFEAIAEKLAKSAEDELNRMQAFILDHFRVNVARALGAILQERRVMLGRLPSREDGKDGDLEGLRLWADSERFKAQILDALAKEVAAAAAVTH
jgi:GTP-binding protein EngB required for normal cell division